MEDTDFRRHIKHTPAGMRVSFGPGWGFYAPHILFSIHDHNTWMFAVQEWKDWLVIDLATSSWLKKYGKGLEIKISRGFFKFESSGKIPHMTAERSVTFSK